MNVEQILFGLIGTQLGIGTNEISPKSHIMNELGADSLDTVELVMSLEEEFDCEIADEDAEKITNIQQAIDYINANT